MVINFNRSLYKLSAIEGAIKDFQHLATFKIKKKDHFFAVDINGAEKEIANLLPDEFGNYVLYLMRKGLYE